MAGLLTIVRKEVSDAVTSRVFLLSVVILFACMVLAVYTAGVAYTKMPPWRVIRGVTREDTVYFREQLLIIQNLDPVIRVVGALVAIVLGFNTIRRESSEGSLKVLLTYPVYRDQVVLGKLLGGLLVLGVVVSASLWFSFGIYVWAAGLVPEAGTLLNYGAFTLLSIQLLSGSLGLSVFLSLAIKESKTALLILFFLLGVFNTEILYAYGIAISDVLYGPSQKLLSNTAIYTLQTLNPQYFTWTEGLAISPAQDPRAQAVRELFAGLSPAHGFTTTSLALMAKYRAILAMDVTTSMTSWDVIVNNLASITALVVMPIFAFVGSYILFTRRDII